MTLQEYFNSLPARREPRAEYRKAAQQAHELYVALRDEGFSAEHALTLVAEGMFKR